MSCKPCCNDREINNLLIRAKRITSQPPAGATLHLLLLDGTVSLSGGLLIVPEKPTVCLVRVINGTQHPALRFQVTVDPKAVNGEFIRIGPTPGDELVGWWLLSDLVMDKLLGYPTPDGKGWVA